mmetsp:Transcript_36510/g.83746  ORF Transcript_36510/g.83746 Transcript_36510/m.83746 type:complete len:225 (+) Transcript_36510:370-1044(+)
MAQAFTICTQRIRERSRSPGSSWAPASPNAPPQVLMKRSAAEGRWIYGRPSPFSNHSSSRSSGSSSAKCLATLNVSHSVTIGRVYNTLRCTGTLSGKNTMKAIGYWTRPSRCCTLCMYSMYRGSVSNSSPIASRVVPVNSCSTCSSFNSCSILTISASPPLPRCRNRLILAPIPPSMLYAKSSRSILSGAASRRLRSSSCRSRSALSHSCSLAIAASVAASSSR